MILFLVTSLLMGSIPFLFPYFQISCVYIFIYIGVILKAPPLIPLLIRITHTNVKSFVGNIKEWDKLNLS